MNHKEILTQALERCGINQAQLAEKLNVSKSTISTTMRRDHIGLDVFVKYMNAMGFEVYAGEKIGGMFQAEWDLVPGNDDKRAFRAKKE